MKTMQNPEARRVSFTRQIKPTKGRNREQAAHVCSTDDRDAALHMQKPQAKHSGAPEGLCGARIRWRRQCEAGNSRNSPQLPEGLC